MAIDFIEKGAKLDKERRFRYTLWRTWAPMRKYGNFVMLNPSTADENVLDPTVTRCVGYAKHWGYDALFVTNIFALRATDPRELYACADPVGPANDQWLRETADHAELVVCAWGTHGKLNGRGLEVAEMLQQFKPKCLGLTKHGHPKHPLYLRKDADLLDFRLSVVREMAGVK
jgi:hypothetical protein